MTLLQKRTLDQFFEVVGKKTLNEYANLTGIERTRIFRIFNGAEMKLCEFEIFQGFLLEFCGDVVDWRAVVSQKQFYEEGGENRLSRDVTVQLERSQRLNDYLNELESEQRRAA